MLSCVLLSVMFCDLLLSFSCFVISEKSSMRFACYMNNSYMLLTSVHYSRSIVSNHFLGFKKKMEHNAEELFNQHLVQNQAVAGGGALRVTDMFSRTPTQLEQLHSPLLFLTPLVKKRIAVMGRWKRLRGQQPIRDVDGNTVGVRLQYQFKWLRDVQPRPRFHMLEYMRSVNTRRAICHVQRLPEEQVGP